MSSPGVPLTRLDNADPNLFAELLEAVEKVARRAAFTLGAEVEAFEEEFAAYCDSSHAVGVSSGTDALALTLRAVEVGPGDEVIVPANSFIATAEAVSMVGATPRLVDVDPRRHLLHRRDRGACNRSAHEMCDSGSPVRQNGRDGSADETRWRAPAARRRGRLPGPRRAVPRQTGGVLRRSGLFQLLPGQESRRVGRRRCPS